MPRAVAAVEIVRASAKVGFGKEAIAMDAELKRDAKAVIDRIVQLRDSL
jgi:hypothetical protein